MNKLQKPNEVVDIWITVVANNKDNEDLSFDESNMKRRIQQPISQARSMNNSEHGEFKFIMPIHSD